MMCGFGDTHPGYLNTSPIIRMIGNAQVNGKKEQDVYKRQNTYYLANGRKTSLLRTEAVFTECFLMLTFIPISGVCMLAILLDVYKRQTFFRL